MFALSCKKKGERRKESKLDFGNWIALMVKYTRFVMPVDCIRNWLLVRWSSFFIQNFFLFRLFVYILSRSLHRIRYQERLIAGCMRFQCIIMKHPVFHTIQIISTEKKRNKFENKSICMFFCITGESKNANRTIER